MNRARKNTPATLQAPTVPGPLMLTLNAGSSSLRFALFAAPEPPRRILSGIVQGIGLGISRLEINPPAEPARPQSVRASSHGAALEMVLAQIEERVSLNHLEAIGHRVLHGGERYSVPHVIDAALVRELKRLRSLGPEHLPAQISLIETMTARLPRVPQVACFDTAFHHDLPATARLLPLPRRFQARGVRRYGFHGLSYQFLLEELARLNEPTASRGKLILAHLGNGASLAAVRDGRCVDTSMGVTPAAGLVMGRRSGDIDPGLLFYFARTVGMTYKEIDHMLNFESGLLGVSEISSDMRELLEAESSDSRAAEAVALFCYQTTKWIGAFTAALNGMDAIVFSGGIGEHCASIRARVCDGLRFLGLELDTTRNNAHASVISSVSSRITVRVVPTDEEHMIARATRQALGPHRVPPGKATDT